MQVNRETFLTNTRPILSHTILAIGTIYIFKSCLDIGLFCTTFYYYSLQFFKQQPLGKKATSPLHLHEKSKANFYFFSDTLFSAKWRCFFVISFHNPSLKTVAQIVCSVKLQISDKLCLYSLYCDTNQWLFFFSIVSFKPTHGYRNITKT